MNARPLRIGELAAASGLTRDALRYYERQGLLPRSRRTSGGFREYDGGAVDRVRFIKQAQAHGLTLREIRDLVSHQSDAGRTRAVMCGTCWPTSWSNSRGGVGNSMRSARRCSSIWRCAIALSKPARRWIVPSWRTLVSDDEHDRLNANQME